MSRPNVSQLGGAAPGERHGNSPRVVRVLVVPTAFILRGWLGALGQAAIAPGGGAECPVHVPSHCCHLGLLERGWLPWRGFTLSSPGKVAPELGPPGVTLPCG